ncbi:MAG: hypothetical protein IJH34_17475 [Romboutsia sp.]|uniref:hypothetical protein n=1 Tax=Clostridium sp. DSM 8431 TaxID=1761781 RepID=UPI0008EE8126|nr:hypothetical protein [Clostridium sp. DSM 8431]MBQ3423400.1 hypothetical protein [Romboutsia sp.]SFU52932.1 hypothetical protein SAMN04487886_10491 [Clostridium sp. DSM 8431]
MSIKKYSLKFEIILIFIGMFIFNLGYFFNHLKSNEYSDIMNMIESVDLSYPILYFIVSIIIIIYRIYTDKYKRNSK